MYYRSAPAKGPYVSKRLPHEKKTVGENKAPRDVFERTFPSPRPTSSADDTHADAFGASLTSSGELLHTIGNGVLQNASFSSREGGNLTPFSRTTSQHGAMDLEQQKTMHKAYHISFNGDKRVKETNVTVTMNGFTFLLVERTTSGQSDGVYQKNKKLWEHVPRGQVKVFVSVPLHEDSASTSVVSTPLNPRGPSVDEDGTASPPLSARGRHRYDCVGTLCGLRKFGHFGDKSAAVFAVPKETVVSAVAVERVDGAGGQVAALVHSDERYWLVGSKTRHLLVRFDVPEEDVLAYVASPSATAGNGDDLTDSFADGSPGSADRTLCAAQAIARAWRATLSDRMDPSSADALHAELVQQKWTLCFDAILEERAGLIDHTVTGMQPMALISLPSTPARCESGTDLMEDDKRARGSADACSERSGTTSSKVSANNSAVHSRGGHPDASEDDEACSIRSGSSDDAGEEEEACVAVPLQSLVFFAITADVPPQKGLCVPLDTAYALFDQYHLLSAPRGNLIPVGTDGYSVLRECVAAKAFSGGAVLYGVNQAGLVVQLWKCRCTFHTMERVAQESVVSNGVFGAVLRAKLRKSISNMPKSTRCHALEWEQVRADYLARFSEWLYETKQMSPSMDPAAKRHVRDYWLSLQRQFSRLHESSDDAETGSASEGSCEDTADANDGFPALSQNVGDKHSTARVARPAHEGSGTLSLSTSLQSGGLSCGPEAIVLVGPQGCGKSTIARVLYALLEQCHQTPRWVNQDEVGSRHVYITAIEKTVREGLCSHILLDKMNLNAASRSADYGGVPMRTALTLAWTHARGTASLANVCFDRICQRGDSHRSLKAGRPKSNDAMAAGQDEQLMRRLRGILEQSVAKMEMPTSVGTRAGSLSSRSSPSSHTGRPVSEDECSVAVTAPAPRLVELDVCWDVETCIQAIWPRLSAASAHTLPDLSCLDVSAAIAMSHAYEALLSRHPHRTTSVVLDIDSPTSWTPYLPNGFEWEDRRKPRTSGRAHFVIHDFVADPSPRLLVEYDALSGTSVDLQLEAVVADCRVTVLCARCPACLRRSSNLELRRQQSGSAADYLAGSGRARQFGRKAGLADRVQNGLAEPLLFAVVAQAKKVPLKYSRELVERVLVEGEADPYCTVHRLPPSSSITATCALKSV